MKRLLIALILLFSSNLLSAGNPKRVVSIAPSFTEILYALGLDEEIVGTTTYCDYPEPAKHTEKIGDAINPNLEKILSLKPDLVLAGKWKWKVPETLRKMGLRVVEVPDAERLPDLFSRIRLIGDTVGRTSEADRIIAEMKRGLNELQKRNAGKPRIRVYVELDSGNWTIGGSSYLDEALQYIGAENIFHERKEAYFMVTSESIASRNPDIVMSMWRTREDLITSPGWQALQAVREGRILDKNSANWDAITRQGARLVEGLLDLEKRIHSQ